MLTKGFLYADKDLEPLKINTKLLGLKTPTVTMDLGNLKTTTEGLLLPKEFQPKGFEELMSDFEKASEKAAESEVYSADKLLDIWGPTFEEDPFRKDLSEFEEAVNDKLGFYITAVKCVDETHRIEWGHDEIAIAGVSIDEDGDVKKIPEKYVGGGFDDGDIKTYSPHWNYHTFSLREGKGWPKAYCMTLLLAEKDLRGFSKALDKAWNKIKEKVWAALEKLAENLPSWWKIVGKIVVQIVKWIIDKLFGWIIRALKDDVFPPCIVDTRIYSFGTKWRHPDGSMKTYSPRRKCHFYGFNGHYYVEYYWKMYS
jgi:hypothetical protein